MNLFTQSRTYILLFLSTFLVSAINLKAQLCLGYEIRSDETNSEEVFLDILAKEFKGIASFQFTLNYEPVVYELIGLESSNLPDLTAGSFNFSPVGIDGAIGVAWFDKTAVGIDYENGLPLFTLKFKKLSDEEATFDFTGEPVQIEIATANEVINNFENCATGENLSPAIKGKLFIDENLDCEFDEGELNSIYTNEWKGWKVIAEQDGKYHLSGLSLDGSYELKLFSGKNNIELLLPSPYYSACEPNFIYDEAELDVNEILKSPIQITEFCPYLEVSLRSFPRSPCEETLYYLKYRNNGTADAADVFVEFDLDYRLIVNTINVDEAFEDLGDNKYRVNVGDLPFGESGYVSIFATIPCEISEDEILRNEARIYPNEICGEVNQNWSGASLKVSGKCEVDKVIFEVENIGNGDMIMPQEYIVIEDAIIFKTDQIQLAQGAKETITLEAKGATYFMQIPQEVGHPGNYRPSAFIEACGRDENGSFSTGFANRFPEENNDDFVDIDYQILSNDGNGNRLITSPVGYANDHYITPESVIEYTLFFRKDFASLQIIDTLSLNLDITTFKPILANLPYEYEIEDGVLKMIIPPPTPGNLLDDRNGYVKFSLQPKAGLEMGSLILNTASLYYSNNEIQTSNTVFHTILADFIDKVTPTEEIALNPTQISVYPNPSSEMVVFTIKNGLSENYYLSIFDIDGTIIQNSNFNNDYFKFYKDDLAGGTYLYRLISDNGLIENGFFILID